MPRFGGAPCVSLAPPFQLARAAWRKTPLWAGLEASIVFVATVGFHCAPSGALPSDLTVVVR
jgi:hypothetical protein